MCAGEGRSWRSGGDDEIVFAGKRYLRAQLVERQPLQKVIGLRRGAIDQERFPVAHDQNQEQDLALRRQQPGRPRFAGGQLLDVDGQKPLEEYGRILARHRNHGAVVKAGNLACHGA
jgi:hypothetical protein